MTKSPSRSCKPLKWIQQAYYVIPPVVLALICLGIAVGIKIDPVNLIVVTTLNWRMANTALGYPQTPLINLPPRNTRLQNEDEKHVA